MFLSPRPTDQHFFLFQASVVMIITVPKTKATPNDAKKSLTISALLTGTPITLRFCTTRMVLTSAGASNTQAIVPRPASTIINPKQTEASVINSSNVKSENEKFWGDKPSGVAETAGEESGGIVVPHSSHFSRGSPCVAPHSEQIFSLIAHSPQPGPETGKPV